MAGRGILLRTVTLSIVVLAASAQGRVVVFHQAGFPALDAQEVSREALTRALSDLNPEFLDLDALRQPGSLDNAQLLVLPYGSACPADAWKAILDYLGGGGSLLVVGGRPLAVPVYRREGRFSAEPASNAFSRSLGIWHAYEAPQKDWVSFVWDEDYYFLQPARILARRVFVSGTGAGAGRYRGLGFLVNAKGVRVASPVTAADSLGSRGGGRTPGGRYVFLSFEPEPGYWDSQDGALLLKQAAAYARQGAARLWLEVQNATLVAGEVPQVTVHLLRLGSAPAEKGAVRVELLSGSQVVATEHAEVQGGALTAHLVFRQTPPPGHYVLRGTYAEGEAREAYHTGFWVREATLLARGPALRPVGDYFEADGKPFLPVGTNYFSTDTYPTGFFVGGHIAGNAWVWERDFTEMEKRGVNFVRTGTWHNQAEYINRITGGVEERFLRALEAFLHSAARHRMQVNFTFFAFDPQTIRRYPGQESSQLGPGTNPYTDPVAIRAQQDYVRSIVARFRDVPFLSWDFINEPSFSNPKRLWRGNTPNADPSETRAWTQWLARRYRSVDRLAAAWGVTPEELGDFQRVPLPAQADLELTRYGNARQVRALDYNLFAQDMFNRWVAEMIAAVRATGSRQMTTVGQDEGGVTNRLLNQFYGGTAVDFTVNHSWWRDDALLWDSVVAKRPGKPNLIGETGVQPVWNMDATWRWDEVQAAGLLERKLVLGLAGANAGSLHWDWSRGDVYGSKRSDGSAKSWEDILAGVCAFARAAAPYMRNARRPEIALILPQSLQLSVFNGYALEAQQKAVRALYHHARGSAYAVGEYQIELLGSPKLMLLPAPWILSQQAWDAVLQRVTQGAVLVVSGRLDADEHFRPTDRVHRLGLDYRVGPLDVRGHLLEWPGGRLRLTFAGDKTTYLERGVLPGGRTFEDKPVGKGRILYVPVPLELSEEVATIGEIYRYAMRQAGVKADVSLVADDPAILVSPTFLEDATLYVLTSESSAHQRVSFRHEATGRDLDAELAPGRAALLLVRHNGQVVASYNLKP